MNKNWLWIIVILLGLGVAVRWTQWTLDKAQNVLNEWVDIVGNVASWAVDTVRQWTQDLDDVAQWVLDDAQNAGDSVLNEVDDLIDWAAEVVNDSIDTVDEAAQDAWNALDDAAWTVRDEAQDIVDTADNGTAQWRDDVEGDTNDMGNVNDDQVLLEREWRAMWKAHNWIIVVSESDLQVENWELIGWEFVVDMSTIQATDIESERLDNHLKADDFFDVEQFPTSTLVITDVDWSTVTADLTIKWQTHPVTFDVDMNNWVAEAEFSINSERRNIVEWAQDVIVNNDIDFAISIPYEE